MPCVQLYRVNYSWSTDLDLAFCFYFQVDEENAELEVPRIESPGSDCIVTPKSLVQSVLEATAMRANEPELRPVSKMSLCLKFWTSFFSLYR